MQKGGPMLQRTGLLFPAGKPVQMRRELYAAENRASVAEERAKMAENEVTATLTKANAAETKAKSLEERATQAENAEKTLQESARTSDVKMTELVQKKYNPGAEGQGPDHAVQTPARTA